MGFTSLPGSWKKLCRGWPLVYRRRGQQQEQKDLEKSCWGLIVGEHLTEEKLENWIFWGLPYSSDHSCLTILCLVLISDALSSWCLLLAAVHHETGIKVLAGKPNGELEDFCISVAERLVAQSTWSSVLIWFNPINCAAYCYHNAHTHTHTHIWVEVLQNLVMRICWSSSTTTLPS